MRELDRHHDAFEVYYGMGEKRTLKSLADHLKVAERTTKTWSKEFNWQERIVQRDLQNAHRVQRKNNTVLVNQKADFMKKMIDELDSIRIRKQPFAAIRNTAIESINQGKIKINSLDALVAVSASQNALGKEERETIKLMLALLGEAESRQEQRLIVEFDDGT